MNSDDLVPNFLTLFPGIVALKHYISLESMDCSSFVVYKCTVGKHCTYIKLKGQNCNIICLVIALFSDIVFLILK